LRSGELGKPFLAVFHIEGDELARMDDPSNWKGTRDRAGGGAMVDTGYHAVYMLLDLFGKPERVSAQARRLVVSCEHKMDDNTVATLEFAGGVMATVIVSYSVTSKPWAERRYVYCTDASVDMSDETVEPLRVWRDREVVERQDWPHSEHPHVYSIGKCIAHYLECVVTGNDPMVDALHARETLDVLRAIYESSETGRTVSLSDAPQG
jgi:predicted dehydrogenase